MGTGLSRHQGGMAVREGRGEGYKGEKASFPELDRLNTYRERHPDKCTPQHSWLNITWGQGCTTPEKVTLNPGDRDAK